MRVHRALLTGVCGFLATMAAFAGLKPVAVSPGDASKLVLIADTCPTFSWGQVDGASSYELVVYRVVAEGEEAEPVLQESFTGSTSSWTPSLDRCFERGRAYAWSVHAVGGETDAGWSQPSLFEVASRPRATEFEEALAVVRQYLAEEATGDAGILAGGSAAPRGATVMTMAGPAASPSAPAAGGDSALQVNGSPVVTVATLRGALCSTTELRFLDQGDGTVLDCTTGKIWLKDAGCLGPQPYEDGANPNIFTTVADLNAGTEFDCSGYSAGAYADWKVPERVEDLGGLVDSTVPGSPKIWNAAGDGTWMPDDAFVEVGVSYWTADEINTQQAWYYNLNLGIIQFGDKDGALGVWPVRGGQ